MGLIRLIRSYTLKNVWEKTAAELIWQQLGFEIYGTLPDYSRFEGVAYKGHFMHQAIAQLKQKKLTE